MVPPARIFGLIALLALKSSKTWAKIQCFVPGECLDSQILDSLVTNTSRACLTHCQALQGCEWFTFYHDSRTCLSLSGCLSLTGEKCGSNCISGENECPEIHCGLHGRCFGALEGIRKVGTSQECGTICQNREECQWHSYDPQFDSCTMTNDCPALDKTCSNCSVSERECGVIEAENAALETDKPSMQLNASLVLLGVTTKSKIYDFARNTNGPCPAIDSINGWLEPITATRIQDALYIGGADGSDIYVNARVPKNPTSFRVADSLSTPGLRTIALENGTLVFYHQRFKDTFYFTPTVPGIARGSEQPLWPEGGKHQGYCLARVENDVVFIAGGEDNGTMIQKAYLMDFSRRVSMDQPDLPVPMSWHICGGVVTSTGPKIVIFGGNLIRAGQLGEAGLTSDAYTLNWMGLSPEYTRLAMGLTGIPFRSRVKYYAKLDDSFVMLWGEDQVGKLYYFDTTNDTMAINLLQTIDYPMTQNVVAAIIPGWDKLKCDS